MDRSTCSRNARFVAPYTNGLAAMLTDRKATTKGVNQEGAEYWDPMKQARTSVGAYVITNMMQTRDMVMKVARWVSLSDGLTTEPVEEPDLPLMVEQRAVTVTVCLQAIPTIIVFVMIMMRIGMASIRTPPNVTNLGTG